MPDAFSSPQSRQPTLLERVAAGDTAAVREVVDTYGGLVWSLAHRFTATRDDAEDAVQDIFVMLWRRADRYDPAKGQEATFVSILARRLLIDRWRRQSGKPAVAPLDNVEPGVCEDHATLREATRVAARELARLDHDHQTALRLSIEHGRSHSEIAEITSTPIGTVKSRIRTALRRIRTAIHDETPGAAPPALSTRRRPTLAPQATVTGAGNDVSEGGVA